MEFIRSSPDFATNGLQFSKARFATMWHPSHIEHGCRGNTEEFASGLQFLFSRDRQCRPCGERQKNGGFGVSLQEQTLPRTITASSLPLLILTTSSLHSGHFLTCLFFIAVSAMFDLDSKNSESVFAIWLFSPPHCPSRNNISFPDIVYLEIGSSLRSGQASKIDCWQQMKIL